MSSWPYIFGICAAILAWGIGPITQRLARRFGATDDPQSDPTRKKHLRITPLLGGWAIITATSIVSIALHAVPSWQRFALPTVSTWGLVLAGLIIAIGGLLDDRWHLSSWQQLVAPILAILTMIITGIGVTEIRSPLGGMIHLDTIQWTLVGWHGSIYHLTLLADVFTLVWLMVTMYATKLLDGLDGLVSGVGVIGAIVVYLLTLRPEVNQPNVGTLALIFGGACLGFLVWNWHPARQFLGESGSLYVGFILGTLAIISGGKLATALLILGLPIFDLLFVVIYRAFVLHRSPFKTSDRSHLHFRLIDSGWGVRRTVGFLYAITIIFGCSTLVAHGLTKILFLAGLGAFMVVVLLVILRRTSQRPTTS